MGVRGGCSKEKAPEYCQWRPCQRWTLPHQTDYQPMFPNRRISEALDMDRRPAPVPRYIRNDALLVGQYDYGKACCICILTELVMRETASGPIVVPSARITVTSVRPMNPRMARK